MSTYRTLHTFSLDVFYFTLTAIFSLGFTPLRILKSHLQIFTRQLRALSLNLILHSMWSLECKSILMMTQSRYTLEWVNVVPIVCKKRQSYHVLFPNENSNIFLLYYFIHISYTKTMICHTNLSTEQFAFFLDFYDVFSILNVYIYTINTAKLETGVIHEH